MGTQLVKSRQRGVDPSKLTDQQRMFCEELAADTNFNATEAARRVGYKNPSSTAGKLLKQRKIQAYLGKVLGDRQRRLQIQQDDVLRELAYIAMRDPIDLCDEDGYIIINNLKDIPERMRRCIDGLEVVERENPITGEKTQQFKLKLVGKLGALELIMKHLGMLDSKGEGTGKSQPFDWDSLYGEPENLDEPDSLERLIEVQAKVKE